MLETKNIEIMPIKKLYLLSDEKKGQDVAVIAMTSYNVINEKISNTKNIVLRFDDIREKNKKGFNEDIAKKIHNFVDSVKKECNTLYICCDCGESRSTAVAAATYRYFGSDDMVIWKNCRYNPNPYVYKLMCKEYGIKISNIRLKYNVYVNSVSLKKQIKKSRKNN